MIVLMGVSETGKSSLGKMLSLQTGWSLYDAGDFHPKSNKDKVNSALKESYREILSSHNNSIQWVVLNGSFAFAFCLNNLL